MTDKSRAPQAFVLPDAADENVKPVKAKSAPPKLVFEPELEHTDLVTLPQTATVHEPRRFRWLALLVSALGALFTMWAGLTVVQLVQSFFALAPWLGWLAFGTAGVAALAAIAIVVREVIGLWRLQRIEHVQELAARAINLDERSSAETVCRELEGLYASRADVQWGLKQFASHRDDILDPRDRVKLADTLMVQPLDEAAHKIIARRARKVTLLTTVTPIAMLDILFVLAQNFSMLRELATLYGGRPSTLSTLKLARMVATHLAVTGGLALSDNLIQHFVGKGLLGKLSSRLGEGAVNGILTSRIGLAATAVCRPIPREAATSDTLTSLLKEVLTFGDKAADGEGSRGKD
jgi:putative membrane protein